MGDVMSDFIVNKQVALGLILSLGLAGCSAGDEDENNDGLILNDST